MTVNTDTIASLVGRCDGASSKRYRVYHATSRRRAPEEPIGGGRYAGGRNYERTSVWYGKRAKVTE